MLQSWFVGRINTFLRAHGRQLVGWDEILEGGLSPGAIVMSWRARPSTLIAHGSLKTLTYEAWLATARGSIAMSWQKSPAP